MHDLLPYADPRGFLAWLAGLSVLAGVPGYLLAGRWMTGQDRTSRIASSLAVGLLLVPLLGMPLTWLGVPLMPWTYLPLALVLAGLLGRVAAYRDAWTHLSHSFPPLTTWTAAGAVAASVVLAGVIQQAFAGYAASPHLWDASNHSFMVLRIARAGSLDPQAVFGPPWSAPPQTYLMGWHAGAALVTRATGTPAYVSAWYLAGLGAALAPVMLTLFWRAAGLGSLLIFGAVWFVAANFFVPTGIFAWGGFGQIIGLAVLPAVVVVLRAHVVRPSRVAGVVGALLLVALLHVHASEVFLAPLLLAVAWPPRDRRAPVYEVLARSALPALVLVLAGVLPLLGTAAEYGRLAGGENLPPPPGWSVVLREFRTYAGGNVPVLQHLVAPAVVVGLLLRRTRCVAVAALLLGLLYVGLRQVQDPASLLLGTPFYRQAPRAVYPQLYLMPVLLAGLFLGPVRLLGRRRALERRRWFRVAIAALLIAVGVVVIRPGVTWNHRNLANKHAGVPFTPTEAAFARRLAAELPADVHIANQITDGSVWAMHVSGLAFTDPCGWPVGHGDGGSLRPAVRGLVQRPWPDVTRRLEAAGVTHVYVSDINLRPSEPPLTRELIGADPRFRSVLRDSTVSVYEILWSTEHVGTSGDR
jgi:hypothetical protein